MKKIKIIGLGLSGSEVALILAKYNFEIEIYEMRPKNFSKAHRTDMPAELVCSNSLRSDDLKTAAGILKNELKLINSPLINIAYKTRIEGGSSLIVDRNLFQIEVKKELEKYSNIKIINQEIENINLNKDEILIIATGPLTTDKLFLNLNKKLNDTSFSFFDATSPIVSLDSINLNKCFFGSRFNLDNNLKTYLNCPFTKDEYLLFFDKLLEYANNSIIKDKNIFEGCQPIEKMALKGIDTLRYGPLKPIGIKANNLKPYAVIQLRKDDNFSKMYNIVGFQTGLKEKEQKEILKLIPGLENVSVFKYGRLHESKYINSPNILDNNFKTKFNSNLYIIGQLTGIEGYIESIATASVCAYDIIYKYIFNTQLTLSNNSIIGSLENYARLKSNKYIPIKSCFGILKEPIEKLKKDHKKEYYYKRSNETINKEFNKIIINGKQ